MEKTNQNTAQNNQSGNQVLPKHFIFHEDSGHGWLEVPYKALLELGIAMKITDFSYRSLNGETVYLEEDMDAGTFINAYLARIGKTREDFQWMYERRYAEDSFIRRLPRY